MTMRTDGADLVFIVGHYKSGSTWLLNALSLHPEVRGIAETHIFEITSEFPDLRLCTDRLYSSVPWANRSWKNRLSNWSQPLLTRFGFMPALDRRDRPATLADFQIWDQLALRRQLLRSRSVDEYCLKFFAFLWDRLRPQRCLIEKTPSHIRYVDRIKQVFPQSTLVAIYRDGRDVVTSDRFFTLDYRGEGNWSFEESVVDWRRDIEAQERVTERYGLISLSYESFLENPEETLEKLLTSLNLRAGSEVLEDLVHRSSFKFLSGRERGSEDRHKFNRKGIAGDWRNHFSDDQKRLFKELAGEVLIRLGYEKDDCW
jgi:hypothetical protein